MVEYQTQFYLPFKIPHLVGILTSKGNVQLVWGQNLDWPSLTNIQCRWVNFEVNNTLWSAVSWSWYISYPSANEVHRDVLHLWLLRQNHDPNGQCRGEPRNEIHFHPPIIHEKEKKRRRRRCWCFAINMSNHKMTPARWNTLIITFLSMPGTLIYDAVVL